MEQYAQLVHLSDLVWEWNGRINLVSRKECDTALKVWDRHVVPSVVGGLRAWNELPSFNHNNNNKQPIRRVVDVGTGGGFPGLPLAICFPQVHFTLVDSVGKKLVAVQDMVDELQLSNVDIVHGRAESLPQQQQRQFDVALGRSVSALPQFCSWMHHLLSFPTSDDDDDPGQDSTTRSSTGGGHLLYWIGGELESDIERHVWKQVPIPSNPLDENPKRVLILSQSSVSALASAAVTTPGTASPRRRKSSRDTSSYETNPKPKRKEVTSRGAWKKPQRRQQQQQPNGGPEQDFVRYQSHPRQTTNTSSETL